MYSTSMVSSFQVSIVPFSCPRHRFVKRVLDLQDPRWTSLRSDDMRTRRSTRKAGYEFTIANCFSSFRDCSCLVQRYCKPWFAKSFRKLRVEAGGRHFFIRCMVSAKSFLYCVDVLITGPYNGMLWLVKSVRMKQSWTDFGWAKLQPYKDRIDRYLANVGSTWHARTCSFFFCEKDKSMLFPRFCDMKYLFSTLWNFQLQNACATASFGLLSVVQRNLCWNISKNSPKLLHKTGNDLNQASSNAIESYSMDTSTACLDHLHSLRCKDSSQNYSHHHYPEYHHNHTHFTSIYS